MTATPVVSRAVSRLVGVLGMAVTLYTVPAHAEPGATVQWLMDRPLTLWDMGMIRLRGAAERAADAQEVESSIRYIWDDNEIEISLTSWNFKGVPTHEKCNEVRRHFIGKMFLNPSVFSLDDARTAIRTTLNRWFSHEGFENAARDKELGEKLSRIVFVGVHLSKLLDDQAIDRTDEIHCRDRVTVFEAPSKPHFLFKPEPSPNGAPQ